MGKKRQLAAALKMDHLSKCQCAGEESETSAARFRGNQDGPSWRGTPKPVEQAGNGRPCAVASCCASPGWLGLLWCGRGGESGVEKVESCVGYVGGVCAAGRMKVRVCAAGGTGWGRVGGKGGRRKRPANTLLKEFGCSWEVKGKDSVGDGAGPWAGGWALAMSGRKGSGKSGRSGLASRSG